MLVLLIVLQQLQGRQPVSGVPQYPSIHLLQSVPVTSALHSHCPVLLLQLVVPLAEHVQTIEINLKAIAQYCTLTRYPNARVAIVIFDTDIAVISSGIIEALNADSISIT